VCVQGAFGAWTVTHKLMPVVVTTHLVFGLSVLALMTWLSSRERPHLAVAAAAARWKPWVAGGFALLLVQVTLGGWVSTNYAALACMDFPLCHGALVPQMDFQHGFTLWRSLGKTADGDYLPFAALTAIHWTHRVFAFVVAAWIAWVAWRALRIPGLKRIGRALLGALALQIAIGIATVSLKWPLALAVAHNGCAALLVLL